MDCVKLSVIVPVYNAENSVGQCLESVLAQSLQDLELICVDDGSTDGSLAILQDYAAEDVRVKVLTQENLHAGPARNRGLEAAQGEYVHFLDADDCVLPYAYECLFNKATKYDLDVLRCAAVNWDEQQQCFVDVPRNSLSGLRTGDFNRLVGLEEGSPVYKVAVTPWAGIFRRSFLMEKNIRFNDLYCVNDRSFFDAAITNAGRMMVCRDRVVLHRTGQSGSLIGGRAEHFDCHFRSIEQVAARLAADRLDLEVQERILKAEFHDLMVWFKKYCQPSEPEAEGAEGAAAEALRGSIAEQTAAFVEGYGGPFAHVLRGEYREALRQLEKPDGAPVPQRRVEVRREGCEHPKVSVVVPVYNVEDYLNEAMDSLVNQTLQDIEFICVNDGSTDGSLAILREYAALDGRIRILDGPNGGYGKAMNRGIDAARGEYVGILEPDDFVPCEMFEELYRAAKENDVDFVKADFYRFRVNPDGSLRKQFFQLSNDNSFYNRVLCPGEEQQCFGFVMNTWSGIYKLDFLNRWHIRHNETPGASYQDNGFFFQTFCCAERALFVDKPYYMNRRDNPGSSMFSSGKVYCVTQEYAFIEDWLKSQPGFWEKYSKVFYWKKFSNFLVTYRRIAPQLQREYLHHLKDEFEAPLVQGLIDEELFGDSWMWRLREIVEDPDAFADHVRVSVVMPVYNAERYLREAIDSALGGNDIPVELICVDDGSTDGSLAILREYEERDPRVHVISQENAGAGAARNAGLEVARGDYLSFLDADDLFEPSMLRKAYDEARLYGADIVVFGCDEYLEETGEYTSTPWAMKKDLLPAHQPFAGSEIDANVFGAFVGWTWDKLFRADFVRENGLKFQELRTTNDMLFTFSAIVKAERIATMGEVLVHRRVYAGSLSTTREKSWRCFHEALLALRRQLEEWGLYEEREQDFVNYCLHACLWNLNSLVDPAYHELYAALKGGWLDELGVTAHGADYFYDRSDYQQLQALLSSDPEGFLFWRLNQQNERNGELQKQLNNTKKQLDNTKKQLKDGLVARLTARIDIRNIGAETNRLEFLSISDADAVVDEPEWLRDESGSGSCVTSSAGSLDLRLRCVGEGELSLTLMGRDIADAGGQSRQLWIDYTSLVVDGKPAFSGTRSAWVGKPYQSRLAVADGQVVEVSLSWHSHDERGLEAEREQRAALDSARAEVERLRLSTTWKAGRALTWLPRKIKHAVKTSKNKEKE